jgi:hypothetical protein
MVAQVAIELNIKVLSNGRAFCTRCVVNFIALSFMDNPVGFAKIEIEIQIGPFQALKTTCARNSSSSFFHPMRNEMVLMPEHARSKN